MTTLHKYTGYCTGLAVEWTSSQLYWIERFNSTISVSDLDGNNRHVLVSLYVFGAHISGIALDPYFGSMFLTYTPAITRAKIVRATLSGTQAVSIVTSNLRWPFVIDLDRQSRLVFWVDGALGRVESVDYYGNNRKLLFQSHQRPWPGYYYYGVTFLSPFLFVSDRATHGIYKFNATSANGTVVSNVSISQGINGLVAYDSSRQLPVITCPALSAPSNGGRHGCSGNETVVYNEVCQFSCDNGYIGFGSQLTTAPAPHAIIKVHVLGFLVVSTVPVGQNSMEKTVRHHNMADQHQNSVHFYYELRMRALRSELECSSENPFNDSFVVDNCTGCPCHNNGTCTRYPGGYNCTCRPEFYGDNCKTFDNCTSSPCLNDGTCTRYPGGYNCTCRPEFYGDNCENIFSTAFATTRTEGSKQKSAIIVGACVGGVLFVVITSIGLVFAYKRRNR
ncbi:hypothetical protein ACROYT_G033966 [Oculina patagonica]